VHIDRLYRMPSPETRSRWHHFMSHLLFLYAYKRGTLRYFYRLLSIQVSKQNIHNENKKCQSSAIYDHYPSTEDWFFKIHTYFSCYISKKEDVSDLITKIIVNDRIRQKKEQIIILLFYSCNRNDYEVRLFMSVYIN
jgi:hypothetical protein